MDLALNKIQWLIAIKPKQTKLIFEVSLCLSVCLSLSLSHTHTHTHTIRLNRPLLTVGPLDCIQCPHSTGKSFCSSASTVVFTRWNS